MPKDQVMDIMEEFDGTTRQLFFKIKWISEGREYSEEAVDKIPCLIREQPRHILKPKERKYTDLWVEVIKENNLQDRLNWDF